MVRNCATGEARSAVLMAITGQPRSLLRAKSWLTLALTLFLGMAMLAVVPAARSQVAGSDALNLPEIAPHSAAVSESSSISPEPSMMLRVDVELVLVPVTVTDHVNRPVVGLGKTDFQIYEDGQEQPIRYFSAEDAPISVGLILDTSSSMAAKIDMEREAVGEFFRNAHPQDDYFAITFADRPRLLGDFTQSVGTIQERLAAEKPAGYTALLDAVYLGLETMKSARYRRRALLIISDGGENDSRYKAREIKNIIQEAEVQIYAIHTFDALPLFRTMEEKFGSHLLADITEASGGHTISTSNAAEIPKAVAAISRELRNQYLLGYRLSEPQPAGKWRKVKVRVTSPAKQSLRVFYKKGYFIP